MKEETLYWINYAKTINKLSQAYGVSKFIQQFYEMEYDAIIAHIASLEIDGFADVANRVCYMDIINNIGARLMDAIDNNTVSELIESQKTYLDDCLLLWNME